MSLPDSFLDLSGLKKYTKKLLKAIQDAVVIYVAGDGVSIEDETINVDNPMRGIYTQAQFDALSDDEKIKGTYLIKDTNVISGGSSFEVYDDQEQLIGSWFGEPLYRRTINVEGAVLKTDNLIVRLDQLFIKTIVSVYGFIGSNSVNSITTATYNKNGFISYYTENNYGVGDGHIILEYTKTTDTIQEYTTLTSEVPINVKLPEGYTISIASATSVASIASASGGVIL